MTSSAINFSSSIQQPSSLRILKIFNLFFLPLTIPWKNLVFLSLLSNKSYPSFSSQKLFSNSRYLIYSALAFCITILFRDKGFSSNNFSFTLEISSLIINYWKMTPKVFLLHKVRAFLTFLIFLKLLKRLSKKSTSEFLMTTSLNSECSISNFNNFKALWITKSVFSHLATKVHDRIHL